MDFRAHAGTTNFSMTQAAPSTCTTDTGHTTLTWIQDNVAGGLITKRTTVQIVLSQRLALGQISLTALNVTVQESEIAAGADGGKAFAKTAIWTMPAGSCQLTAELREYWGTKTAPGDYRYTSHIACTESAQPANVDAQPNALLVDSLKEFHVVQD